VSLEIHLEAKIQQLRDTLPGHDQTSVKILFDAIVVQT